MAKTPYRFKAPNRRRVIAKPRTTFATPHLRNIFFKGNQAFAVKPWFNFLRMEKRGKVIIKPGYQKFWNTVENFMKTKRATRGITNKRSPLMLP